MPKTLSPFRYPGGKTKLSNFVNQVIENNNIKNCTYVEPFAGGFGIGIELLLKQKVSKVVINDFDKSIYSVWFAILNYTDDFISLIKETPITIENWKIQKENYQKHRNSPRNIDNAFATFFLNRTNRSGIISAGPIGGYEQNGNYKLDCRFNKVNLIEKIKRIAEQKDKIELFNLDALELIEQLKENYDGENTFIFFDPPYYQQGSKLYMSFYRPSDHQMLADKISELDDFHWIVTYDDSEQISDIYRQKENQAFKYHLNYTVQRKRVAEELMFGNKNLDLESQDALILEK